MSSKKKTSKTHKPKAGKKMTVAQAVAERKAEELATLDHAAVSTPIAETPTDATPALDAAPKTKGKKAKAPKDKQSRMRDDGTYSVLDAAHKVLTEAGTPLASQTILERALAEGYWKTSGKTPAATIYAAIIRDIAAKGDASRFKKVGRGQFVAAN